MLDPRLKLDYYRDHKWEKKLITEALQLTRDAYKCYAPSTDNIGKSIKKEASGEIDVLTKYIYNKKPRLLINEDDLTSYITCDRVYYRNGGIDTLQWWQVSFLLYFVFSL